MRGSGGFRLGLLALAATCASPAPVAAAPPESTGSALVWFTLGTHAGPVPSAARSQPAHLLVAGDRLILVDAGDGAAERMAKLGVTPGDLTAVVLSHLHHDHAAGLSALIGLRYQLGVRQPLRIIGPPGTRELIVGVVASLAPLSRIDAGQAVGRPTPAQTVRVDEIGADARIEIDGVVVTTAENTHYATTPDQADGRPLSLSLRFENGRRAIVYTGDTGPSDAVERLARGADLLVSEMIDRDAQMQALAASSRNLSPDRRREIADYLAHHHLSPEQVGTLAARAGVRQVVITHFGPGTDDARELAAYRQRVAAGFRGPVTMAADLDNF